MGNPLKVYSLGHTGVIIDSAPTEPSLPLDALTNAQNATHDPKEGHMGALRKRAGLRKFNTTFAGGAILGGIPMLVAGTGGAPAQTQFPSVDDSTGSPVGAGAGTGAPGSSTGGSGSSGGGSGVPSAGAGLFPSGATSYPGQRLMIVGRANNFNPGGGNGQPDSNGWYIVRSDWGTALAAQHQTTTPGPPEGYGAGSTPFPPTATFLGIWGKPSVFDPVTGYLYYALSQNRTSSPPTPAVNTAGIHKINGAVDVLLTTLPGGGQIIYGMCMSDDGSAIFVATHSIVSANTGNLYRVDKATGSVTQMGYRADQTFPGAPFCLSTFNGRLWIGEWQQSGNEVSSSVVNAQVDGIPVQDGTGLVGIDHGFTPTAGGMNTTCLIAFPKADLVNQCLFAGFGTNGAAYSPVYVRQRTGVGDPNGWAISLTPSDSAAFAGNCWTSFCEFNGKLYGAWRNGSTTHNAVIYQFTPTLTNLASDGGWNGTGTWTAVYTITQGSGAFFWNLYTDGGYLYAIAGTNSNTNNNQAVFTPDGTTWTDKSSVIFDHGVNDDCPMPYVLFLNQ